MMEEHTSSKMSPLVLVAIVAFIVILGYIFLRGSNQTASKEQTAEPTTKQEVSPTKIMTDVKTITIEAGAFYYKPNKIRVKKGQKVKIVMTAKDMMHDFNIDELSVKMPITKAGSTNTVEFTADQTGEFEYYCSVGQHRTNGQVGTFIVED